jgi:hypothetical protein
MRHVCPLFLFATLLLPASLQATVLVPADLGELSRDAQLIARGRVTAIDPVWTGDWRSIETVVTLEVEAAIKGAAETMVRFRVPGGQVGRLRRVFLGAPVFEPGSRVVVFLGRHGGDLPHLLGLSQGVFRVVPEADGWVVSPPAIVAAGSLPQPITRGDRARRAVPLAVFEAQVRTLAGSAR